ncbi:MAG: glycosyltransferase [Planctomycetota bacterium]|jgi:glycosyltransferase involved in cell wall biosynthesis|nr:glycosyltransferase [Planctomycetota bacterium]
MPPQISVIVPVYRVERFLSRAVKSILAQTFADFELLLVDDCSPDGSGAMCDKFAVQDKRVRVIHKPQNGGSSQARKTGLDAARGNFIACVDADDWLEPNFLSSLYEKITAENAALAWCDYWQDDLGVATYNNQDFHGLTKEDILRQVVNFSRGIIGVSLWNKLVARELFQQVKFSPFNYGEDRVAGAQLIYYAPKIAYTHQALYHYCYNPLSFWREQNADGQKLHAKRTAGVYANLKLVVDFLREKYGDLAGFEPDLSRAVNEIKFANLRCPSLINERVMTDLYPQSNRRIFDPQFNVSRKSKIALWLAAKGCLLPFRIMNFIKPVA